MLTEEQIKLRSNYIGGSDAGAVLGISGYTSRLEMWMRKTGRMKAPDLSDNKAVEFGNFMEKPIARYYWEQHPTHIMLLEDEAKFNPKYPFMIANYDRVGIDEAQQHYVLEIKNIGQRSAKYWQDEDNIPLQYLVQVYHYMIVGEFAYGVICAFIGGQDYKEYRIERDADIESMIIKAETEFYQYWQDNEQPPILATESQTSLMRSLNELYDSANVIDEVIEITDPSIEDLPYEIDDLKKEKKEIDKQILLKSNLLREAIGQSASAKVGEYWVNYKPQSTKRVDTKQLKEFYPHIAERVMAETITRILRINKQKEK